MLIGEAHLELGALPDAHESEGVLAELFTCCCEVGAGLRSFENGTPKQVFETLDAGRDRRLRDVELGGGLDEAASLRNHQEGSREIDIHGCSQRASKR